MEMALVCVRCHVSLTRLGQATCRRSPAVRIQHSVCRLAASTSEGRLPKPMHPMDVSHVGRQGPGRTRRSSRFGRPARRNFPATKMWVQHAVPQDSVHGNMVVQHCVLPLWWLSLRALWFCFLCYLCRVFVREGHCSRPHVFPSWPFVHVGGLAFCFGFVSSVWISRTFTAWRGAPGGRPACQYIQSVIIDDPMDMTPDLPSNLFLRSKNKFGKLLSLARIDEDLDKGSKSMRLLVHKRLLRSLWKLNKVDYRLF